MRRDEVAVTAAVAALAVIALRLLSLPSLLWEYRTILHVTITVTAALSKPCRGLLLFARCGGAPRPVTNRGRTTRARQDEIVVTAAIAKRALAVITVWRPSLSPRLGLRPWLTLFRARRLLLPGVWTTFAGT